MDKKMIENEYVKELEALHFYLLRYTNCEKTVREYEHCRRRYLQHSKTVEYYKSIIRQVN